MRVRRMWILNHPIIFVLMVGCLVNGAYGQGSASLEGAGQLPIRGSRHRLDHREYRARPTDSRANEAGTNSGYAETTLHDFTGTFTIVISGGVRDSAGNLYGTTMGGGAYGWGSVFRLDASGNQTVLYSFTGINGDGEMGAAGGLIGGGLFMDSAGNLYGATSGGGAYGMGTVFKVSPAGQETVLYSFTGANGDGRNPNAGLIMDSAGNLYGTTYGGGSAGGVCVNGISAGCGTIFKVSPTGNETVLYNFTGTNGDGRNPHASLIRDSAGNLYGTTVYGGEAGGPGAGTVFKVSPTGNETVLYSFSGTNGDGADPEAGLVMDSAGNLYGTTSGGGDQQGLCDNIGNANGCGIVFKVDPTGHETVLYSFSFPQAQSGNGAGPYWGVIMDNEGNLYGTTEYGGIYDGGTIFKLAPTGVLTVLYNFTIGESTAGLIMDGAGNFYGTTLAGVGFGSYFFKLAPTGSLTTLHTFPITNGDGASPTAGLIMDSSGNLYGTTQDGGAGEGTVFRLDSTGHTTVLHSFFNYYGSDGEGPNGLIMDSSGNLYGTTFSGSGGGLNEYNGTVFKVDTTGREAVLYSFTGANGDGANPEAGLIMDSGGNLYGTTLYGGNTGGACSLYAFGCGTVFKVDATGHETVLYSFTGANGDGRNPYAGLIMDGEGNLYGTALGGGNTGGVCPEGNYGGCGTVFKVDQTGHETVLYSFTGTNGDGAFPYAGLSMDIKGNLYGTTQGGGANGVGTVFKLDSTGHETVLYSFTGKNGDGAGPVSRLIMDSAGNLYGTTDGGGADGVGTVFKVDTKGQETVLYSFTGTNGDGANPEAGLVMDSAGNLYGTTVGGGAAGTVFKLASLQSVSLSPTSLTFGNQVINTTSATKTVTLTNTGAATLDISNISASPNFAVSSTTCKASLAAGKKCQVKVTFTPTQIGPVTGTLTFTDTAPDSPQTVVLSGTGIQPATLTPASANYGRLTVGTTSKPKTFTLANNQIVQMTNIAISTTGDFAVSATNCTKSLAPKSKCWISVTFTPTQTGTRTGQLSVKDNASNSPQTSNLTGTGK